MKEIVEVLFGMYILCRMCFTLCTAQFKSHHPATLHILAFISHINYHAWMPYNLFRISNMQIFGTTDAKRTKQTSTVVIQGVAIK